MSVQEAPKELQDPRYWAVKFGQLTLQGIRAGYPVSEIYHTACLAASHAEDVLDCRPAFQIEGGR